jgi:uncharacterized protein YaaN involved in tellurite resistance
VEILLIVTIMWGVSAYICFAQGKSQRSRLEQQMEAVNKLVEQLDSIRVKLNTEQVELDRKAEVFAQLILKAKPLVESLEKVY